VTASCRLCQAGTRSLIDPRTGHEYHRCGECELILLDRTHLLNGDQERARYLLHENSALEAGYKAFLDEFVQAAVIPAATDLQRNYSSISVLDYGAGPEPVLAMLLSRLGFRVEVFDPYFHSDGTVLDGSYDIVLLHEVIEHVSDPALLLTALTRLVKPGGNLLVRTRFHPEGDDDFLSWWYRMDSTHVAFYSERTFQTIPRSFPFVLQWTNRRDMVRLIRTG
jgi:SAM-dependent methyltransferase